MPIARFFYCGGRVESSHRVLAVLRRYCVTALWPDSSFACSAPPATSHSRPPLLERVVSADDLLRGIGEAGASTVVVGDVLDLPLRLGDAGRSHQEHLVGVSEEPSPRPSVNHSRELEEEGGVDSLQPCLLLELSYRSILPALVTMSASSWGEESTAVQANNKDSIRGVDDGRPPPSCSDHLSADSMFLGHK
jgi:hypothetical protein